MDTQDKTPEQTPESQVAPVDPEAPAAPEEKEIEGERTQAAAPEAASAAPKERKARRRLRLRGMHRRWNFGRLLIGVIVLFFGLALLAQSFGWFPAGFAFDFAKYWPLLIVAAGLSLLDPEDEAASTFGAVVLLIIAVLLAIELYDATTAMGKSRGGDRPAGHLYYEGGTYSS